jgi:hypothetical protein
MPGLEPSLLNASDHGPSAGGRFARWNQKAVRERETSAQPTTFAPEIEGQIRVLNLKTAMGFRRHA